MGEYGMLPSYFDFNNILPNNISPGAGRVKGNKK
jgi:hypothetical protein